MPKKILIVDDDPGICDSLAIIFRDEGYCVDDVTGSEEAARLIKKHKYDICIFDYKMKGLGGMDLLQMTKAVNPHCLVFIVSGMMNIYELCRKATNAGLLAGIIQKPFDVEMLVKRIAATVS